MAATDIPDIKTDICEENGKIYFQTYACVLVYFSILLNRYKRLVAIFSELQTLICCSDNYFWKTGIPTTRLSGAISGHTGDVLSSVSQLQLRNKGMIN